MPSRVPIVPSGVPLAPCQRLVLNLCAGMRPNQCMNPALHNDCL